MMELGRVRIGGEKIEGKVGKKLDAFRFTSASYVLLDAVAQTYGGNVEPWTGAPDGDGYFQVYSKAMEINIILPPVFAQQDGSPTTSYSQWFEHWTGGGCKRRCDGVTEAISAKPCLCNRDDRTCDVVTRVSFLLPDIPGLGMWRLETKGYNAAVELPGTLEMLLMAANEQKFLPAVLRIEHRTKRVDGEKFPRRFIVPVIDLPQMRVGQLLAGQTFAINAPAPPPMRPALPASVIPAEAYLEVEDATNVSFGNAPALPASPSPTEPAAIEFELASESQRKLIFACAQQRGVAEAQLREIVLRVAGVESSKFIPKNLVNRIVETIENEHGRCAEPVVESRFKAPTRLRGDQA